MTATYHFFTIPVYDPEPAEAQLNQFLQGKRVATVERSFLPNGDQSAWAVCVSVTPGPGSLMDAVRSPATARAGKSERIDYRDILNADEFALFAKLRDLRNELAQLLKIGCCTTPLST